MVVRLRLQRFGRTHSPFYRMVAADARAPRDGKFLEIVRYSYSRFNTHTYISHATCVIGERKLHVDHHSLGPHADIRKLTCVCHASFFLFQVGTYNPIATRAGIKEIRLKTDRLKYWLSVGAQPTTRVGWILGKFGILPPPPPRYSPERMIPKKDRDTKKK